MDIIELSPRSQLSDSYCLLEWIRTFPHSHLITTLNDVNQSSLIVNILKELDSELYKSLLETDIQNISFAWQLSKYLLKHICKEVILSNNYSVEELVSKLLYICVHSEKKEKFIETILMMDQDVQSILMRMIEKIQDEVETVKESRTILDKISDLQTGNQELQESLNKNKVSKQELNSILQQTRNQVKRLDEECEKLRKQRTEVARELQMDQFAVNSFVKIYKKIQSQNIQFSNNIKQLQTKVLTIEDQNKNLKQKIIEDGLIISKYNQDAYEMKSSLRKLRSFKHKAQFFSDQSQMQQKSSQITESYTQIVKQLQDHIVTEKEKYTKQIVQYDEQLSTIKSQNQSLKSTTRFLSSQIGELKKVYSMMKEHVFV